MEVVTVLGAGLLVGTALTVIIPEGVNTLFSLQGHHKTSERKFFIPWTHLTNKYFSRATKETKFN